jgi:hypothetical protein
MLPLRPFCDSSFLREEEAAKNEKRRGKTSPYFAGEEERTREKETRASLIEVKTQGIWSSKVSTSVDLEGKLPPKVGRRMDSLVVGDEVDGWRYKTMH